MGKGEIACYEQFLFFPQCFQKTCSAWEIVLMYLFSLYLFQSLISSACLEHLDFLGTLPDSSIFIPFEEASHGRNSFKSLTDIPTLTDISDSLVLDEHVRYFLIIFAM